MLMAFWVSAAVIVYAYFGYSLLLMVLTRVCKPRGSGEVRAATGDALPTVSLIISAYNEERVIGEKVANSLSLDYPKGRLEVLVVSDGSTDRTDEIVGRYAIQGVRLLRYEGRLGKTGCLNRAVRVATGAVVVFTDANSMFEKRAIRELVRNFADPGIGFATGHTSYVKESNGSLVESVGIYAQIEIVNKKLESQISSCVGADGAIFAIRRELYQDLSADDINDLVIPLRVVRQGYRGVLEESAICYEGMSLGVAQEFPRQVRIATRTLRAIWTNADLLNPFRYGFFATQFFSHKFAKLLVPGFLIAVFLLSAALATESPLFVVCLLLQILGYVVGIIAVSSRSGRSGGRLIGFVGTFLMYNLAISFAWWNFIRGKSFTVWATARQ